jgi:xanthine dehydrogenase accessory factor
VGVVQIDFSVEARTMTLSTRSLAAFLSANPSAICAELTGVRGSSPREAGAFMLIGAERTLGTIGGGALEYLVIARARQVLRDGLPEGEMDIPLGPEIGQCCGGRVEVSLRVVDRALAARLAARVEAEQAALPHVYLFGSGHVGHALARALALLPVQVHVIDTRPEELTGLPGNVEAKAVALPEAVVRSAPAGSSYVILTHDHALDFLIASEALQRDDAPYVGMVGSKTKRARFTSWYLGEGGDAAALGRLVLPIGGVAFPRGLGDKRPEVIAALAAAEIMVHIGGREVSIKREPVTSVGALNGR